MVPAPILSTELEHRRAFGRARVTLQPACSSGFPRVAGGRFLAASLMGGARCFPEKCGVWSGFLLQPHLFLLDVGSCSTSCYRERAVLLRFSEPPLQACEARPRGVLRPQRGRPLLYGRCHSALTPVTAAASKIGGAACSVINLTSRSPPRCCGNKLFQQALWAPLLSPQPPSRQHLSRVSGASCHPSPLAFCSPPRVLCTFWDIVSLISHCALSRELQAGH